VPVDDIIRAETPGKISSIWTLSGLLSRWQSMSGTWAYGISPMARILVRLRELANSQDHPFRLSPTAVAALAEGAW
jgi:hypothetical protein